MCKGDGRAISCPLNHFNMKDLILSAILSIALPTYIYLSQCENNPGPSIMIEINGHYHKDSYWDSLIFVRNGVYLDSGGNMLVLYRCEESYCDIVHLRYTP